MTFMERSASYDTFRKISASSLKNSAVLATCFHKSDLRTLWKVSLVLSVCQNHPSGAVLVNWRAPILSTWYIINIFIFTGETLWLLVSISPKIYGCHGIWEVNATENIWCNSIGLFWKGMTSRTVTLGLFEVEYNSFATTNSLGRERA